MADVESPAKVPTELSVGKTWVSAITFAVSTGVAFYANKSLDEETRKFYTSLAPAIGLLAALLVQTIANKIFYWRGNQDIKGYIAELKLERHGAIQARKRAIDIDIADWHDELKRRRKANLL